MLRLVLIHEMRWAAAAVVLFAAGLGTQLAGGPAWVFYLACYVAGGWEPALDGLRALRYRRLDVDLLMVVAALGAAAIGQWLDGALLIVIFATSGALEVFATRRTEESVRGLLHLAPDRATLASGETVEATSLRVGDEILVRPGDRIAADGRVLDGVSDVDQAGITGEPLPVVKRPGAEVFAGTVNGTGALRVRVERPAADTVVARIVAMVEKAGATKAGTQLLVERIEQRYSIAMVAATIALLTVPLLFGAAFEPTLLRAMTFMIVASPCAVVLATMPPMLAAIATAGRHGVLIKSAVALERLATTTRVALDKTGTVTEGRPRVTAVVPLGRTAEDLLLVAASAEARSEHPIAHAITTAAREAGLTPLPATSFTSVPGQGIKATIDHRRVRIESPASATRDSAPSSDLALSAAVSSSTATPGAATRGAAARGAAAPGAAARVSAASAALPDGPATAALPGVSAIAALPDAPATAALPGVPAAALPDVLATAVREAERRGETVVVVHVDDAPAGVIALADRLRPGAATAIAALTAHTGAPPLLLTGDNPAAAAHVAAQTGIHDVRAGLLPDQKADAIRREPHRLLMIGDGVNDAPALAAAHAGIAMGRAGADLTVATADAVIVRDDLCAVPAALHLARRARRLVVTNLVLAFSAIAVLVTWDLAGHLPLPLGVAGHEGSTILVALNGLRLLSNRAWRVPATPTAAR